MKEKLPDWFARGITCGREYFQVLETLEELNLNTVCEEANCPNRGECYANGTATFLIMGDVCTRNCRFCAIEKRPPEDIDVFEPKRIAKAIKKLNLKYVVITSVTRDDLPDGGASHFEKTIRQIRWLNPAVKIEVLIPDFQGNFQSVKTVADAKPDVMSHNLETVPRLYRSVRPKAEYQKSLDILYWAKLIDPQIFTKSGLMLGLGETKEEIIAVMQNLRKIDCDFLTLGQYLSPSANHLKVERFIPPEEFEILKETALGLGFKAVASAPLVRSSYLAERLLEVKNGNQENSSL